MAAIKLKGLDKTLKGLKRIEQGIPRLNKLFVDSMAFETRKEAVKIIQTRFVNRNKFTVRNTQFQKAQRGSLSPESEVGSRLQYMADQEFGQTIKIHRGIPTDDSRVNKSRARSVRKKYRFNKLGNLPVISGKRKAIKAIKVLIEKKSRSPVRLKMSGVDAVYVVDYGSKGPQLRMLFNLSEKTIHLKPKPWLNPALQKVMKRRERIFLKNLNFFLKK